MFSVCATQCLCFTEGRKENMWSLDTNMAQGEQRNQDHRSLLSSLEISEYKDSFPNPLIFTRPSRSVVM
jgi:hypothetical protein